MLVWRLTRRDHTALDGEGARLHGGRWTASGTPAIYTSSHLSLAVLEVLVNLDIPPELLPSDYMAVEIRVPDNVAVEEAALPKTAQDTAYRETGEAWVKAARAAVLSVPSVIVPRERNFIINPRHPAAREIAIIGIEPFMLDPRLVKRKP